MAKVAEEAGTTLVEGLKFLLNPAGARAPPQGSFSSIDKKQNIGFRKEWSIKFDKEYNLASLPKYESIDTEIKNIKVEFKDDLKDEGKDADKITIELNCIKCSIKKLELDMKLANEDSIGDEEFLKLVKEITTLCSKYTECGEIDIDDFINGAIMKRKMNKLSAIIKIASVILPILSVANKTLLTHLGNETIVITDDTITKTQKMCSYIVAYILGSSTTTEQIGENLENISGVVDYTDTLLDAGIIEGIFSFVSDKGQNIVNIVSNVKDVVVKTYKQTNRNVIFSMLPSSQKLISIALLTLLSINILLNIHINNNDSNPNYTEKLYYDIYQNATKNLTIGNGTTTGGGKRTSKSRRAANAAKPRAKPKPANATKPKTPTKPTKQPAKPKPTKPTKPAKPTKPTKQPVKPKPKTSPKPKAAPKKN